MATWPVISQFIKHCIYLVFFSVFRCCQLTYWRLTGIQSHLDSCRSGRNHAASAQLLKVWFRSTGRRININLQHHFLSTHVRFVHPEYALQAHVTLMSVSDKEAIFSISAATDNVFDVKKWPLVNLGLLHSAKYLLVMPLSSLIKLGEDLGDPKVKVVWLYNTSRCGGTALMQAFNSLPDVVAISGPKCMISLDLAFKRKLLKGKYKHYVNSDEYRRIYRNIVRLLLKPSQKEANVVAVRSHGQMSKTDLQLIPNLFPQFSGIFMYRNAAEQISSLYRVTHGFDLHSDCALTVIKHPWLSALLPNVWPLNLLYIVCNDPQHLQHLFKRESIKKLDNFVIAAIQFGETCFHYKAVVAKGAPITAFKYEHFLADKLGFCEALFHHAGMELTAKRRELIAEAWNDDSHKSTPLNRDLFKHIKMKITDEMVQNANSFLQYYDLPGWNETTSLPNTVQYSSQ